MVNLAFLFYHFLCPGRIQNSWAFFLSFSTKFFDLVWVGGHSFISNIKADSIQKIQKGKQAKGIIQVLRKSELDPDKDPAHLEAILDLHKRLCTQRRLMNKKNLPMERFEKLDEEIEGIEIILFNLIPKKFIQKLERGHYLKFP